MVALIIHLAGELNPRWKVFQTEEELKAYNEEIMYAGQYRNQRDRCFVHRGEKIWEELIVDDVTGHNTEELLLLCDGKIVSRKSY